MRRIRIRAEDQPIWNRFRRNLSISLLGSGVFLAVRLAQTALLIKFLRIDDYGRVVIVLNLFFFLESFAGLRLSDLLFRFFQMFKERRDARALQGLLLACLSISLATGLLISGGAFVFSPWLADRLYHSPDLAPLFMIYGCTVLASAFREIYEPLLRMHDRFAAVVVPQVLGGLTTLAILVAYFATADGYDLKIVVAAFTVGGFVQTLPPLVETLRLLRPALSGLEVKPAARALAAHRPELISCLFNSNLSGYLKFAISPGDLFLVGVFSTPAQTALYGLARQLTAPLALLQTNIQTAITPEVTSLAARRKFAQLKGLVSRYVAAAFLSGSLLLASGLLLGRLLIIWLARPEYLPALPVFYSLLAAAWLILIFLVFRPVALGLDLLKWHNLAHMVSAAALLIFIAAGRLDALTMGFVQLAGAALLRPLFNLPVWARLRALAAESRTQDEPREG